MKKAGFLGAGVLVISIILCSIGTVDAGPSLWPMNKGEISLCNVDMNENVSMAVMRTVGNHYIVHGVATDSAGNKSLFSGNAIVDGNKILMHVSASGVDGDPLPSGTPHGTLVRVELGADTLEGYAASIDVSCGESVGVCSFSDYPGPRRLMRGTCP